MKIAFYADHPYYGQLANNGGTRTILKSVETLRAMGHEACVVAHKDRFTWFKHDAPIHSIPACDAAIAVSIADLTRMLDLYGTGMRLAYWARPVETWQDEQHGVNQNATEELVWRGGKVFCNSTWQAEELRSKGVPATVLFAGIDYDDWLDRGYEADGLHPVIGCQYSTKPRKNWHAFEKLADRLGKDAQYVAFGSQTCPADFLSLYLHNPSHAGLASLYRGCDIFFCPNKHEGFYNCGAEAALCGATLLVDSRQKRNGMSDYADESTAMMYDCIERAAEWVRNPDYSKRAACVERLRKIGTRQENMTKLVEALSE